MSKQFEKGLTLVELLVSIAIIGLAISLLSSSIFQQARQSERLKHRMVIHQGMLSAEAVIEEALNDNRLSGEWVFADVRYDWSAQEIDRRAILGPVDPLTGIREGVSSVLIKYQVTITALSDLGSRQYSFNMLNREEA